MINAVSGISFKGENVNVQDLINSPGQFATVPQQEAPADSFEKAGEEIEKKDSKKGLKIAIGTALAALAAFVGLGIAVHKGSLKKADIPAEGFFEKSKAHIKNFAYKIGDAADSCYNWIAKKFGKEVKKPDTNEAEK